MKKERMVELLIDDFSEDLGVEIMSLVDRPAIGVEWMLFSEEDESKIHTKILEMAADESIGELYDPSTVIYIDISKEQFKFNRITDFLKGVLALDILGRKNIKKEQKPIKKYKYTGPTAERNFCKAMLNLNKIYTEDEIDRMSATINTGFRHQGQPYSIFDFKGGVNCKHYWEDLDVFKNDDGTYVFISHGKAKGKPGQIANSSNNYWRFSDEDQRIVTGPAMIPNLPIKRIDPITNEIFYVYYSEETVKKISEKFLANSKHNNTDINHSDLITNQNTLLESWIVEDPLIDKSKLMGFENIPKNTWMVSYRINDNETWNKIKNGDLTGFSITGSFKLQ
jgi:hypothetical protein